MALNSLCLGTDGALKRGITKTILVLGVSGMLHFGNAIPVKPPTTPPTYDTTSGGGWRKSSKKKHYTFEKDFLDKFNEETKLELLRIEDEELLIIIKAFLLCL